MYNNISFKKWLALCLLLLCVVTHGRAQTYAEKVRKYVYAYQNLAIQEQLRSGIPASVTLGQGILETEAGCSELATGANNHFGIKCKKEWKGETFTHTDDRPDECFRKYSCAGDSYKDHSDYLRTGPRYASLFRLSPTDYAAWAFGLKKCGYATNPVYAQKLIKIIEDFELQEYTYKALNDNMVYKHPKPKEDRRYAAAFHEDIPAADTPGFKKLEEAADEARATIITTPVSAKPLPVNTKGNTGGILKVNGLKAIQAYKGDMLLQYAVQYNLRYEKILEYNDLPDAPLAKDMYLYLEKKPAKGQHERHIVRPGETMWQIAQDEPMQLQRLMTYNMLQQGEEPNVGVMLEMQHYASTKPRVVSAPAFIGDGLAKNSTAARNQDDDYIKTSPAANSNNAVQTQPATTYNDNYVGQPAVAAQIAPVTNQDDRMMPAPATAIPTPVMQETKAPVQVNAPPPATTQPATVPQEPQDELSRLKARLDKIVYAGDERVNTVPPTAKPLTQPKPVETVPLAKKRVLAKAGPVKYYTVKKGDTAFNICKRYNMTVAELQELNAMEKPTVALGQKLKVK
jgi:LysM repeat protein